MRVVMTPGWLNKVRAATQPTLHHIAGEVRHDVRRNLAADGLIDTGALYSSVYQAGTRVYIGTDHWHFIEYGTRPHVITPRVKRALWWVGAAHPVKLVHHPGNREYAPMRRALYKKR